MKFTAKHIAFLNVLNNLLTSYEPKLIEKVKEYYVLLEQKIQAADLFTSDYEVEVEVSYYRHNDDDPMHIYNDCYKTMLGNHPLLNTGEDWREGDTAPMLDKPYCYLMHNLMFDSRHDYKEILKIDTIWMDIKIIDQHLLKLTPEIAGEERQWRKMNREELYSVNKNLK